MGNIQEFLTSGIQIVQCRRQTSPRGLEKQMEMVGHEDISMNQDPVALINPLKTVKEASEVLLYQKDCPPLVPSRSDMVKGTLDFDSQWS
jgi:hypothetical protein